MPCQVWVPKNGPFKGQVVHLCRTAPPEMEEEAEPVLCSWCKQRVGDLLCDWEMRDGENTCDAPLCAVCAEHVDSELDFCPKHDLSLLEAG